MFYIQTGTTENMTYTITSTHNKEYVSYDSFGKYRGKINLGNEVIKEHKSDVFTREELISMAVQKIEDALEDLALAGYFHDCTPSENA